MNGANPRLEQGIVVTGIPEIDSLNAMLYANNFQYYDFTWTTRLKYILQIYFDPDHTPEVEVNCICINQQFRE
ncbi:MAG: hypothetical protein FJ042_01275 [Candidatus Cloacimonetes bacterium]|nr:hypothetical protein [Candidatus Cloacimonadota bacterium]